jgi:hypothetical protein
MNVSEDGSTMTYRFHTYINMYGYISVHTEPYDFQGLNMIYLFIKDSLII